MEDKSAKYYTLITGASAGIGKQIATECAKKGHNLLLVALPNADLDNLQKELQENYSSDIQSLPMDLTIHDGPKEIFSYTQQKKLKVNILINNAGVGFNGKFENYSPEVIDQMILLNIRATTLLTLFFLPEMKKMEKAHIVNISSFAAFTALPYKSVYAATKSYHLFLTQAINNELKNSNVRVMSVHPSGVSSKRTMKHIQRSSILTRITALTPEKVAKVVVESMEKGRHRVIPGIFTQFYYLLGYLIPHGVFIRIVGRIFRNNP